jgi:uracil-DNA glycosylase
MIKNNSETSAKDFFPSRKSIKAFREAAADCKACDLWKRGTQTVFGEGARRAEIVFVGEQPGNEEDLSGKPFVGPARMPASINAACRPWLEAEIGLVKPKVIVCLALPRPRHCSDRNSKSANSADNSLNPG